jgi:hypothetical protein
MAYLRENWRGQHRVWVVVNAVAAEAQPGCRWQMRDYTRQALMALMELIRGRRVLRFGRTWVAALDLPQPIVPLEPIPPERWRRI